VIATVDIADVGVAGLYAAVKGRPRAGDVPGLRWADVAALVPLGTARPPKLHRAALVAFWDDEGAAQAFAATKPDAGRFSGGFHATLRPLRAFGSWPGLPGDIPRSRSVPHEGPVVVLTLGRLRLSQLPRFIRASRPAERSAVTSDGIIWGTAAARPPFVATISIWADSDASAAYAFSRQRPDHSNAIAAQQRKDFHRQSAFVRFAPVHVEGALGPPNPLAAGAITDDAAPRSRDRSAVRRSGQVRSS
jgi:hypothetical protein